ncbi:ZNF493 isoform 9, partial [Pan troglodytes]
TPGPPESLEMVRVLGPKSRERGRGCSEPVGSGCGGTQASPQSAPQSAP